MHPLAYRHRLFASLVAATALLAAACGGTAAPATSAPATSTAATSAAASSGAVTLPKPEKTEIKMGFSALSGAGSGNAIILRQENTLSKYGIKATFVMFNSATAAMQALIAGQVDVSDNSAGPVLATVGTASPMQYVFVPRANNTDILYSAANVKTAADLKGKTVAISSFGSNSYAGAIMALKALNLTDKDVTLTAVGNDTQRLAALKSGAVAASIQDNTQEKTLNAAGFNSLVRIGDIKPPFGQPAAAVVVPVDFLKKYPNTTLAITAAYLEVTWRMQKGTPEELAPILQKELTDTKIDDLKEQIKLVQQEPWTPKDGMCRKEDVEFAKQVAVAANPNLASIDPMAICNNDFLLKLKDLGFQKKLGLPGY